LTVDSLLDSALAATNVDNYCHAGCFFWSHRFRGWHRFFEPRQGSHYFWAPPQDFYFICL